MHLKDIRIQELSQNSYYGNPASTKYGKTQGYDNQAMYRYG